MALLLTEVEVTDALGVAFKVLKSCPGQRSIIFGWVSLKHYKQPNTEDSDKVPSFSSYGLKVQCMMQRMGYNLKAKAGLNFGKGRRVPLKPRVPEDKEADYYQVT